MNKLNLNAVYAAATAKTWGLRTLHAAGFRNKSLTESISRAYERRSEMKSGEGAHESALLLLEKAGKFAGSERRKSYLFGVATRQTEKLAEKHEISALALLKKFAESESSKAKPEDGEIACLKKMPRGVMDINQSGQLWDRGKDLFEVATSVLVAARLREKCAAMHKERGNLSWAARQLQIAVSDYKAILACSKALGLPDNLLLFSWSRQGAGKAKRRRMTKAGYPPSDVSVADVRSSCEAALKKTGETPLLPMPDAAKPRA